ncbi:MAG: hypothetical protein COA79_18420 [Planctomycetota bacterium]|nr:MAG: hypothetical protein COA79_18420 [Planctomycetota bacterium]
MVDILIVEDDEDILEILHIYLSVKYNVTIFDNPKLALEAYKINPNFPLVITDYFMPDLRGDQLIHEILAINENQQFILCSGTPNDEVASLLENNKNLIQFIKKPFDFSEFDDAIDVIEKKLLATHI